MSDGRPKQHSGQQQTDGTLHGPPPQLRHHLRVQAMHMTTDRNRRHAIFWWHILRHSQPTVWGKAQQVVDIDAVGRVEIVMRAAGRTAGRRHVEGARIAAAENGGGFWGIEEAATVVTILGRA